MKTSKIILGIVVLIALFTSMILTSCEKEQDEIFTEEPQMNSPQEINSGQPGGQVILASQVTNSDYSDAKIGVSHDCKHVDICFKNGKLKQVGIESAYTHLQGEGLLFDCDPDIGLDLTEIITILTPRIIANGGDFTSTADLKNEFIVWFYETYCPADQGGGGGDEGDGGVFDGDAGSNL
ncbi:MAG: hypothetical protein ACJA0Q_000126 [Saprospiraceae bacterium]|jgi:hypothetical protein